ncbi:hypothetical protein VOLCADRAFT_106625 [Volvox carteri f. nagariensis]|uniref:O-fucosyltransferase family protein n=1 Tax=Volvox carteri f. nagariensis TaxID=3068 RepID=D8U8P6_VOLCA|nr:uncharacterized protein VOLCADRAFT_106625 [Volvox carteri f. nagariensis]EFJ43784.1 hypothetical protein VOLCADRAFT_106625 [Volvox carteri f. nagariensis]|eukprot:XP_002955030.1 hypothetical protein VOLCADRAFT_106625 [Volvox carteri f. nagariensis]
MLSKELFDFTVLDRADVPFVLLDEFLKTWDGVLDAIFFFRDDEFPPIDGLVRDMGLKAPDQDKWFRSPISITRGCRQDKILRLRKMLKPYRYVGMLSYDDFTLQTHRLAGTLLLNCGSDLCCHAFNDHSILLRTSPQVRKLADAYIRKAIGKRERFVASHVRPMPDDCVKLWQSPEEDLDPIQLKEICRNDFMYSSGTSPCCDFHDVPGMRLYNTTTVFIMTHPTIRPRVARMLKAGGINAAFLDLSDLMSINMEAARPLRSPMSFSLLAIVEEAVAADARAFLGTAESSMTGMIVQRLHPSTPCPQERIARELNPRHCYFFSPRPSNELMPRRITNLYANRDMEGQEATFKRR